MCSRHAARLVAEYEAARLADEETSDAPNERDSEREPSERAGVLATVVARLSR
ncbi:hypothetical protein [Salinigranum halophilum]|uniref:hypothetical protein n=1 Tax=Salinigranum halophilum TaxID=2565931 RepID=UPI00137617B7|nr:hypothetical protein [Salinigranum halophilum]